MKILLAAATSMEIAPILQQMPKNTELLITGVGAVSTACLLTEKLLQKKYDLIINAGIAGTFGKYAPTQTVAVQKDAFGDFGIEEQGIFTPIFNMPFFNQNEFPFTDGILMNNHPKLHTFGLPLAQAVTVNKITDNQNDIHKMQGIFDADIETMEGAAFHYVCLRQNVPFLQIRSVSNEVGERDYSKWHTQAAIENLNFEIQKLIRNL